MNRRYLILFVVFGLVFFQACKKDKKHKDVVKTQSRFGRELSAKEAAILPDGRFIGQDVIVYLHSGKKEVEVKGEIIGARQKGREFFYKIKLEDGRTGYFTNRDFI